MAIEKLRGEIGDLRNQLMRLSGGGSSPEKIAQKRDLFRKLIILSTTGQDMSGLFMQVITCAASDSQDIILKKSLNQYITTYCNANPELMVLTINMLLKGCEDQDPTIRGLSLRSLCSLTLSNLTEYLMTPIRRGLEDRHPYVRRTAVMGVLKVWTFDPAAVQNSGMLETVFVMLTRDTDPMVISNCMSVVSKAGDAQELLSKALVYSLLNRIKEFSEWAQCQVLEFVSHYRVADATEVYDIMNALDDRLATPNSAVVLATVKVFLNLTLALPYDHQQVLERIKDPLMTLISRDHYETAYVVLTHFLVIARRAPMIFSSIYPSFYCRVNDPSYIKDLKLQVLSSLANDNNAYEIVTELTEYVTDIDEHVARESIRAVGRIALEVEDVPALLDRLIGFLELDKPCVTEETLIQLKDVLRRYPHVAEVAIASLNSLSPQDVEDPEARAAFIWILGEHGSGIQDAPYLLEPLVEEWASQAVIVRLTLLTAAAKLFFMRPAECQPVLGSTLAAAVADVDQDVHDRALLYFRLLQHDVSEAKRIIRPAMSHVVSFAEEQTPEIADRIFAEFNSLSVIYRRPSDVFVKDGNADTSAASEGPSLVIPSHAGADTTVAAADAVAIPTAFVDEGSSLLGGQGDDDNTATMRPAAAANGFHQLGDLIGDPFTEIAAVDPSPSTHAVRQPLQQPNQPPPPQKERASQPSDPMADLLGLSDDSTAQGAAPAAPLPLPLPALQLRRDPQLQSGAFQQQWGQLPGAAQFEIPLSATSLAAVQDRQAEFCRAMSAEGITRMASGGKPVKFYFHSQTMSGTARVLLQVLSSANGLSVTIKSDELQLVKPLQSLFTQIVSSFH